MDGIKAANFTTMAASASPCAPVLWSLALS